MKNTNLIKRAIVPAVCVLALNGAWAATHGGTPGAHNDRLGESAVTDSMRYNGRGKEANALHDRSGGTSNEDGKNAGASRREMSAQNSKAGAASGASSTSQQRSERFDMRASQLVGKDVGNAQGESLGEIKDLFVDLQAGRVPYAVLSVGGGLGAADKLYPFPMTAFSLSRDRGEMILNVGREKLVNMPGFDSNAWPDYSEQKGLLSRVDRFFGSEADRQPATRGMVRASELMGRDVDDLKGQDIGEVQDVVIDVGRGRIAYVVLDFDKAWSFDDKLLPLPLKAFNLPEERNDPLVFKMNRDRLDMAQGFTRNKWPDLNAPAQRATTENYFLALERPTQSEARQGIGTSGPSGGDSGVSGGIYADPVSGASVPRERGNASPSGTSNK